MAEPSVERRLDRLEGWQRDMREELRWWEEKRPMIEALEADMVYRQRRHAEQASHWTLGRILVATGVALYMAALQTLNVFLLFRGGR